MWPVAAGLAALLTPVIRLFATYPKRGEFSLKFQGCSRAAWDLISHSQHH